MGFTVFLLHHLYFGWVFMGVLRQKLPFGSLPGIKLRAGQIKKDTHKWWQWARKNSESYIHGNNKRWGMFLNPTIWVV